jgi:hypothetical protein
LLENERKFFADAFWDIRYSKQEEASYDRYREILRLGSLGQTAATIERILQMSNAGKYLSGEKKPFLATIQSMLATQGTPSKNYRWIPLKVRPRGVPESKWVEAPPKLEFHQQLSHVLAQLNPHPESATILSRFGISADEVAGFKEELFAFLLGTMLGDASKSVKSLGHFPSMTVSLVLSKNKTNSLRFGEFASACLGASTGLQMRRITDAPSSPARYSDSECFRWLSETSPFVTWIQNVCLGLTPGMRSTYDPAHLDWILESPRAFRIAFLQGLCESDAYVDAGRNAVCLASSPNSNVLLKLFQSLGCSGKVYKQPPIERIEVGTYEAIKIPTFSPRVGTCLYENLVIMAGSTGLPERKKLPPEVIEKMKSAVSKATNYNQACLELARSYGLRVSSQSFRKYFPGVFPGSNSASA